MSLSFRLALQDPQLKANDGTCQYVCPHDTFMSQRRIRLCQFQLVSRHFLKTFITVSARYEFGRSIFRHRVHEKNKIIETVRFLDDRWIMINFSLASETSIKVDLSPLRGAVPTAVRYAWGVIDFVITVIPTCT